MRTKLKVLSALVGLVSIGASVVQAQVYSQNVVGYVNVVFTKNQFKLVANPLNGTNNTVGALFPASVVPAGSTIYKWNGAGYTTLTMYPDDGGWFDGDLGDFNNGVTLKPGEATFLAPADTFTNTFVGEVLQGSLTNQFANGFTMVGSMVPQAANADVLGLSAAMTAAGGETVYKYTQSGWSTYTWYGPETGWFSDDIADIASPTFDVAEGFFLAAKGGNWIRSFNVNNN